MPPNNVMKLTSAPWQAGGALAAVLGGVLWTALAQAKAVAWDRDILGLSYEDYNRLDTIPLILLEVGLAAFYARQSGQSGKLGRAGYVLASLGLASMLLGNIVEFWIGGGIRHGDKQVSTIGWNLVLVGIPLLEAGLILFGIATLRARVLSGWKSAAPLVIGVLPVLGASLTFGIYALLIDAEARRLVGRIGQSVSMVSFGMGWMLLGYGLWPDKVAATHPGSPG